MLKLSTPFIAALAVTIAPVANADTREFQTELQYDSQLLFTDEGALQVISSLTKQAKDACSYTVPLFGTAAVDRSCAKGVLEEAINEIVAARKAEGLETAGAFEQRATIQIAALEQR